MLKMKKFICLGFCAFMGSVTLIAQSVVESDEFLTDGTHNALTIDIDASDTKFVEKVWRDFIKKFNGKVKNVKGGAETLTTGAEIAGINGVENMLLYVKTSGGSGSPVKFTAWFQIGEQYLTSASAEKYNAAVKFMQEFAHENKVVATENELNDAEKKLRSLEGDLDKLKKQKTGYQNDIEEAEKKIAQAKDNIVKNEGQQVDTGQKIVMQKEIVEEVKSRLATLRKNRIQ
jgi:hypothetical protein